MPYSEKARRRAVERKKLRAQSQLKQSELLRDMNAAERERRRQDEEQYGSHARQKLSEERARQIMAEHEQETGTKPATQPNWYWRRRGE